MRRAAMWRWVALAVSAGLLGVVFMAYLQPDLAFTLATQLWNCF